MGSNSSKQTKEKKIPKSNFKYEPKYELTERKHQHNYSENPYNEQPIELSWLQQNKGNDNYNRTDHHHHHVHHEELLHRLPLAINRWPQENDQIKDQKSKSFIEEYIHQ